MDTTIGSELRLSLQDISEPPMSVDVSSASLQFGAVKAGKWCKASLLFGAVSAGWKAQPTLLVQYGQNMPATGNGCRESCALINGGSLFLSWGTHESHAADESEVNGGSRGGGGGGGMSGTAGNIAAANC